MHEVLVNSGRALLQVLAVGVVLGAGLPAIFSLGMRAAAYGCQEGAQGEATGRTSALGTAAAVCCFAVVAAAICYGILIVIFGAEVLPG